VSLLRVTFDVAIVTKLSDLLRAGSDNFVTCSLFAHLCSSGECIYRAPLLRVTFADLDLSLPTCLLTGMHLPTVGLRSWRDWHHVEPQCGTVSSQGALVVMPDEAYQIGETDTPPPVRKK